MAGKKKLGLESTRDVALDMIFLAVGSAGGVFNDSKVRAWLGENTIAILLVVVLVDLLIASVLLYQKRFAAKGIRITPWRAFVNFVLGALTLMLVAGVIYGGSFHAGRHP